MIKSIRQAKKITNKKILLRADFNVLIKNGKILDDFKIAQGLLTIRYLLRYKCKIIIITHLGQPKKFKDSNLKEVNYKKNFSVKPIAKHLGKLLDKEVNFVDNWHNLKIGTTIGRMKPGEIVMLENLRLHVGEEKNNIKFAKELASLADIYVNNAFGVSHRKHASLSAIKNYLPSYAGLLLEEEVNNINKVLKPKIPLVVILGGVKIDTKIKLIQKLQKKAYRIIIGGALANNFLLARGYEVGKSLVDKKNIGIAKKIKSKNILFPIDVIVKNNNNIIKAKTLKQVVKDDIILDIGPNTIKLFSSFIKKARTIIWNGPLGRFEKERFKNGTLSIARVVASRSKGKAFGLVGGGETVAALKMTKMQDYVDWVSTGGGAMLTYLEGRPMPGLKGIIKK